MLHEIHDGNLKRKACVKLQNDAYKRLTSVMSETVVGVHVKNCLRFQFQNFTETSRSEALNKLKSEEK